MHLTFQISKKCIAETFWSIPRVCSVSNLLMSITWLASYSIQTIDGQKCKGIIADSVYDHLVRGDFLEEEQKGCIRNRIGTKDELLINTRPSLRMQEGDNASSTWPGSTIRRLSTPLLDIVMPGAIQS